MPREFVIASANFCRTGSIDGYFGTRFVIDSEGVVEWPVLSDEVDGVGGP
jgi:hypothetical protein